MTVGEKLAAMRDVLLEQPARGAGPAGAAVAAYKLLSKFGLAGQIAAAFPPLDDEDAWHELLVLVAGVALSLASDDVEIDAEMARAIGAEHLERFGITTPAS